MKLVYSWAKAYFGEDLITSLIKETHGSNNFMIKPYFRRKISCWYMFPKTQVIIKKNLSNKISKFYIFKRYLPNTKEQKKKCDIRTLGVSEPLWMRNNSFDLRSYVIARGRFLHMMDELRLVVVGPIFILRTNHNSKKK